MRVAVALMLGTKHWAVDLRLKVPDVCIRRRIGVFGNVRDERTVFPGRIVILIYEMGAASLVRGAHHVSSCQCFQRRICFPTFV